MVGVLELVDQDVAGGRAGGLAGGRGAPAAASSARTIDRPKSSRPSSASQRSWASKTRAISTSRRARWAAAPDPAPASRSSAQRAVLIGGHELVAALVDALDQVGDQPAAVAAQVVLAQVELVEPLEQHQHAVLGAAPPHVAGSRPRSTPCTRASSSA